MGYYARSLPVILNTLPGTARPGQVSNPLFQNEEIALRKALAATHHIENFCNYLQLKREVSVEFEPVSNAWAGFQFHASQTK